MVGISFCIPLLWFLPNLFFLSGFFQNAFVFNYLGRITGKEVPRHIKPWYYYFTVLYKNFSPWVWLLPLATIFGCLKAFAKKDKFSLFLLIWMITIFVGFSAASAKLAWYINPAFPAMSLLIGYFLYETGLMMYQHKLSRYAPLFVLMLSIGMILLIINTAVALYRIPNNQKTKARPLESFVSYIEKKFHSDPYQIILCDLNMNSKSVSNREHYYFNRIGKQLIQIDDDVVVQFNAIIHHATIPIFAIMPENTFLEFQGYDDFQFGDGVYILSNDKGKIVKLVMPYHLPKARKLPLRKYGNFIKPKKKVVTNRKR